MERATQLPSPAGSPVHRVLAASLYKIPTWLRESAENTNQDAPLWPLPSSWTSGVFFAQAQADEARESRAGERGPHVISAVLAPLPAGFENFPTG
jgi:hypothetical protein